MFVSISHCMSYKYYNMTYLNFPLVPISHIYFKVVSLLIIWQLK